MNYFIHPAI